MKHKAFTLVELMVVIAVLGLLVAIMAPGLSAAFSMARSTVCQGNLQRLCGAFALVGSGEAVARADGGGMRQIAQPFPKPMSWPTIPRNVVPDPAIYECPEDPTNKAGGLGAMFTLLEYECPFGRFPLTLLDGRSDFYISRTSEDDKGPYSDFMLQDDYGNGQLEIMDFAGWWDIDGFVRVYHSGKLWVPKNIPDNPEYESGYVINRGQRGGVNTCGDINAIWWQGEPAFGQKGLTRNHQDQWFDLEGWDPGYTNYAINAYAYQYPVGSQCIVLVDYKKKTIVEVDTPVVAEERLMESARHLGKLNYLMADGSVRSAWPADISPRLKPELWKP